MSRVINLRNNQVIVRHLEEARTVLARVMGLMGRPELRHDHGMLIYRSGNSIHTFFMKFPIDLVFVNRGGEVKHLVKNVRPWKMVFAPLILTTDCLELPAGTIEKHDVRVGDKLRVEA